MDHTLNAFLKFICNIIYRKLYHNREQRQIVFQNRLVTEETLFVLNVISYRFVIVNEFGVASPHFVSYQPLVDVFQQCFWICMTLFYTLVDPPITCFLQSLATNNSAGEQPGFLLSLWRRAKTDLSRCWSSPRFSAPCLPGVDSQYSLQLLISLLCWICPWVVDGSCPVFSSCLLYTSRCV